MWRLAVALCLPLFTQAAESWLPQRIEGLDRALAPRPELALSEVRIAAVASAVAAEEQPAAGAASTRTDHGGAWLRVDTVEVGQGREPMASFNGRPLRYSSREPVNLNGRSGWRTRWMIEAAEAGLFRFQATSPVKPWPVLTTQIYIR
ncbi:DUF4879 domain-containing protein [Chitinimonas lacunae]|uniref:DUF4879 domain-containing protein n=1 Tax=Chitinimonas lacunae TaxID=1963018 RepID=A0ABV8MSC3_9NEIS